MMGRKSPDKRGVWLLIVPSMILAVLIVIAIIEGNNEPSGLSCFEEMTAQIANLIDPSNNVNETQLTAAKGQVMRVVESLPEKSNVSVYEINPQGGIDRYYSNCTPIHPDSIGGMNSLGETRERAPEKWQDFQTDLSDRIDSLLPSGGESNSLKSPIMEGIAAVQDSISTNTAQGELVVVSDMAQHSLVWSLFWGSGMDFLNLARSPRYDKVNRRNLDGIAATVIRMNMSRSTRIGEIQNRRDFNPFWEDYFIDQGRDSYKYINVFGRECE